MTTTAARVEVLTAEVRVLMVGSRQITLSVYAQLDDVEPGEITPFGRVAPRNGEVGCVYVVGASARDADAGTLVRSSHGSAASLRHWAERCRRMAALTGQREAAVRERDEAKAGEDGVRWRELRGRAAQLTAELERAGRFCFEGWTASKLTAEARRNEDLTGRAALWEALPLIVLAGLR